MTCKKSFECDEIKAFTQGWSGLGRESRINTENLFKTYKMFCHLYVCFKHQVESWQQLFAY